MKDHLRFVLIRPSKYDDDGYVLRFWRGVLPSNTLACLNALTEALYQDGELGEDVTVSVECYDDTVEAIPVERIAREARKSGENVLVGLVGVQTNQFPRASDLAISFRDAGIPVVIGGFHVSGVLALFDEPSRELQRLLDHGVSLVKGEAEAGGLLRQILLDALAGEMRPVYDANELPDISLAPVPHMDPEYLKRFCVSNMATIDTSRGCPFGCTFCTVINVQGQRMRHRSAECVLQAVRESHERGISYFFFTDDNFSRNPVWEEILDGLIELRAQGINVGFMMQVDTQSHRLPRFVDKASRAGCYQVFVGMESVNQANIEAMGKKQNKVSEYAAMVQAWRDAEVLVHVGYIIGLPNDTRESVKRDMEFLRQDIKVDEASFFMLTPLPGSVDHLKMCRDGVPIDADLNNYDSVHETFRHPRMAPGEWRQALSDAYLSFYDRENIVSVLLRMPRRHYWKMFFTFIWYRFCALEGSHPMLTALVRKKSRKERRPVFPRENALQYGWRRAKDFAWMAKTYVSLFFEFEEIWMLTRKPEDPRWSTLADLHNRWREVQRRLHESALAGKYDAAAEEVRSMLLTASQQLRDLSRRRRAMNRTARRRLRRLSREVDSYIHSFDVQLPGWERMVAAEQYVSKNVLAKYEELAIGYVAKRRKFNAYRREVLDHIKSGRLLSLDISTLPRAILFECVVALRFGLTCLTHG